MKRIFLGLFILATVVLSGCMKQPNIDENLYFVTGTVSYYDFSQDRGNGIADGKSYAIFLNVSSGNAISSDGFTTLLGCISGENNLVLYRQLIKPKIDKNPSKYSFTIEKKANSSIQLPGNMSGRTIQAFITKPIILYQPPIELPDQGRVGSCFGYNEITNIVASE